MSCLGKRTKQHGRRLRLPLTAVSAATLCLLVYGVLALDLRPARCDSGTGAHVADGKSEAPSGSPKGNLYLLAVGVSQYQDPKIPNLTYAAKDAGDAYDLLTSQRALYKHIVAKLLQNRQATKSNIERWFEAGCRVAKPQDTLIFYFSGHGTVDPESGEQYLAVAHDTDVANLGETAVPMSGLDFLGKIRADHALIILDTCHAAGVADFASSPNGPSFFMLFEQFVTLRNKLLLTSSRTSEESWELLKLDNGVFTHLFLKGLKGDADANQNGRVTVEEVFRYVKDGTEKLTKGIQHPELAGLPKGPFFLSVCKGNDTGQ